MTRSLANAVAALLQADSAVVTSMKMTGVMMDIGQLRTAARCKMGWKLVK